ncbi:hypothetical protein FEZ33_00405 [Ruoffia tabacinasalis]|uniref:Uncharacterized protein n=1 Tax=Ruoffia tabacinasalis TaxID=87458 RepID=A0A5R9EGE6_9LACT|nr:hypothetical protein [Ruoffia tabacinasalis]TLQ49484.1 hypothetical protein FEZ33_00405 [Ruoffia tabacinasalis]
MSDTIKRYSKFKGYESLPRDLLQSKNLTLEAIGLLANLASYPENWILRKTELRTRFKNGKKAVDRIWDELVTENYLIQFRKRVGRGYEYRYYFSVEQFKTSDIQELLLINFEENFVPYHKEMKTVNFNVIDLKPYIFCEDKEKLDFSFWTSQKGKSTEGYNTNVHSSSPFGKSKMESPKGELSRFTNKEIYYKDKNEEEDIYTSEEEKKSFVLLPTMTEELNNIENLLKEYLILKHDRLEILLELEHHLELQNLKLIEEQLKWCEEKQLISSIGNYPKYFIDGLKMRYTRERKSRDTRYDHLEIPIISDYFNR